MQDDKESGCFDDENEYGKKLNESLSFSDILNDELGNDINFNTHTSLNGDVICGQLHWDEKECDSCSLDDPNGDNVSLDPSDDNWVDCNDDLSICEDDENWDSEIMGDNQWSVGEKFEKNEKWDWIDCDIVNGIKICENDDSWNSASMGNQIFDMCDNYLNNEENCDKYEFFNDIGIDGIPDVYENYNDENYNDNYPANPDGTEGNKFRDENEPFFDYGLDQIINSEEPGYNLGEENNKNYDKSGDYEEYFEDFGLDQCPNMQEGTDGQCNGLNVSDLDDPHDDNYNIDPNQDNYDEENNETGTENNRYRDEGELWYDFGYDQLEDIEEDNYYANIANYIISSGNNYKINLGEDNIVFEQPTLSSTKQVGLWISSIEKINNEMLDGLSKIFNGSKSGLAEENLQARIRGNILMTIANKRGALLLNTGNKTETALGYCTMYGDMAGALAVISDLNKTQVYNLSSWINNHFEKTIIPNGTITKPPSAELSPNQVDPFDYDIVSPLVDSIVEDGKTINELVQNGIDKDLVNSIYNRIRINEYKRRQAAPGLRVSSKAFGMGRRFPIVNHFQSE